MRKNKCAFCMMAAGIFGLGMSVGIMVAKKVMEVGDNA